MVAANDVTSSHDASLVNMTHTWGPFADKFTRRCYDRNGA
jgi:hypothetical protein